jgi:putative Ca2+/H+ antiporter (TMEM165/GDT1 family)
MNWQLFLSIYILIFVAELPDKTAFATLLLAARGRALSVFFGVAAAFLVQTIFAVVFGSLIGLLPGRWVHLGAGFLFLAFALHTWIHKDDLEENEESEITQNATSMSAFWPSAWKAFLVIFIAEWGDLTQIATASLIAKYKDNPLTVFSAALLALWSVTAIAVVVGQKVKDFIHPKHLTRTSVFLFLGIGCYFIWTWYQA